MISGPPEQHEGTIESFPVRIVLRFQAEVPFAGHVGVIPCSSQNLWNGYNAIREVTFVAEFFKSFSLKTHSRNVIVIA